MSVSLKLQLRIDDRECVLFQQQMVSSSQAASKNGREKVARVGAGGGGGGGTFKRTIHHQKNLSKNRHGVGWFF